ncbi:MAG: cytochrome C oxidase subunit IV family protein [Kiritimatiellae bacterium]|nr:cytochrome C oxidase subunit IV family protein [Kiritimatiellia bacterium]
MEHPVVPVSTYLKIFAALMVLTALTVAVAFIDWGFFNDVVAMTIAVIKALLVVSVFMHLKYSARLLWLIAGSSVVWFMVMVGLTLTDYRSRDWLLHEGMRTEPWHSVPAEVMQDAACSGHNGAEAGSTGH